MAANVLKVFILFSVFTLHASNKLSKHFPDGSQKINLVGIFGSEEDEQKLAFEKAIEDVNSDSSLLKKAYLEPVIIVEDLYNSFAIEKKLCSLLENNVTAIFGANSEEGISIVRSVADTFQIPYLFSYTQVSMYENSTAINIFPRMEDLAKGIKDIVQHTGWESYTLIYEKREDLAMFQNLIISHDELRKKENFKPIVLEQLPEDDDYGPLLKKLQKAAENRFVLHCSTDKVLTFLEKARNLKLMNEYFSYVIISLDAMQLDFSEIRKTKTNITTLSLIKSTAFLEDETDPEYEQMSNFVHHNLTKLPTRASLTYDSVYLFARALDSFLGDKILQSISLNCWNSNEIFQDGASLTESIKYTETKGVTGAIKFDDKGERIAHLIEILGVSPGTGDRNVLGIWDPENKINLAKNRSQLIQEEADMIANRTFIVASTAPGLPYLQKCPKVADEETNDEEECYEGFSKHLLEEMAKEGKFKYKILVLGEPGSPDPVTGKWSGLIKELRERRADLGIGDLTITHERRQAVDFTKPFMNLGISILYRKGKEQDTHLFSFLKPLEIEVWLCVMTSLLGISILLFFISRLSPFDWESSHPCDPDVEELENQLSLVNCLWFSLGSVLQQGCDILPKAVSSRIAAAMWWFFTLIMVSTYTANLAAFLTTQQMDSAIKDVEQLAAQSKIKYGCYKKGSTCKFFEHSSENLYKKMWATMQNEPSVFTKSNSEGVDRVLREKNYAFLMESSSLEYNLEQHCELAQIGDLLDHKGYGIAMPLNSPFRTAITTTLLKLQEKGTISQIRDFWWNNNSTDCPKKSENDENENALNVENVGGVFVVLAVGMVFSFSLSILEFLWNIRKVALTEKIPISLAFRKEMRFVLDFRRTTKPVRKPSEETSLVNEAPDRIKEIMSLSKTQNRLSAMSR